MMGMYAEGQKYTVDGKGFNTEDGKVKRDGVDANDGLAVRSALLSALLCKEKEQNIYLGEGQGS